MIAVVLVYERISLKVEAKCSEHGVIAFLWICGMSDWIDGCVRFSSANAQVFQMSHMRHILGVIQDVLEQHVMLSYISSLSLTDLTIIEG